MNILLFTLEYPPFKGGVANVYENIVKYWPEDNDIFVLHNNNGKLINDKLPFLKWIPSIWRLLRALKKDPADIGGRGDFKKIDHILVGHILPLGTAAYLVTRLTKTPYSVILHGMDLTFALKTARKRRMAKKILNSAQNIICMNSYVGCLVKNVVNTETVSRVKVVNPGISKSPLDKGGWGIKNKQQDFLINIYNLQNKVVLFSVGRLVKRKGFDKVLEAMPKALKEIPNLVYVIAGAGPDEGYLKELVNAPLIKGVGGIVFLGKITDQEKWAWFDLCDIFIMPARSIKAGAVADGAPAPLDPSGVKREERHGAGAPQPTVADGAPAPLDPSGVKREERHGAGAPQPTAGQDFEGFGIVYLEANLAGKPVIAGDSGGVRDAVQNGVNGLLVNPESADEIADAIIKLSKDKELRKKLGKQGRERTLKEFNWEERVKKIYGLIKKG